MKRTLADLRHTKFMRQIDRDINRLRRTLYLIQQMDSTDRYYLLSRLKDRECAQQERQQRGNS